MKDEPNPEAIAAEELWKNLPGITKLDYPQNPSVQKQWDMPICKQLLKDLTDNATSLQDRVSLTLSAPSFLIT